MRRPAAPRVRHVSGHRRTPLDAGWQLCEGPVTDASPWLPIGAPGTVADALRRIGAWSLDAPARDFDALEWTFRATFDAPETLGDRCVLGLGGLATFAQVWLNGEPLLSSDNMFVAHEIEVGDRLSRHGNELALRFAPLATELARKRPRPRWRAPMLHHQQMRWVRTTLLGRTPGWSPPAQPVGPWRSVWLDARSGVDVQELRLHCRVQDGDGRLDVACRIEPLAAATVQRVQARLTRDGHSVSADLCAGPDGHAGTLIVPRPARWWPHTHGEPCLYALVLHVWQAGAREPVEVDAGSVGFRVLRWGVDDGDFVLTVNDVPVFCRGACWTPLDPVTLHAPPQAYVDAIAQVRDAGMNMLRVGGTMVYEADAFYDACDAHGVLVWQDFMFANMDYPTDAEFTDGVRREVAQQLARWQARPSLALVCGNSEGEQQAAMWGAPREQWSQPLFDEWLPRWVAELAPGLDYWPSSAHGGAFPFQADAGTASYYGVGAYRRPLADATLSGLRFASECLGFANIPAPATLARLPGGATKVHEAGWKQRSPRDLGAGWDFDDVRDHYLGAHYGIDAAALRACDHERYLMLGRAVTGDVMAEAFAQWRAPGSRCRGALVWFWRDLWAGAGWGLLDDVGVPKACWWMLRRALQPIGLAIADAGVNGLVAHVANDTAEALDARLSVCVYRAGRIELMRAQETLALAPRAASARPLMALFDGFADLSYAYRFGPRGHDVVAAQLHDVNGRVLAQAVRWFDQGTLIAGSDLGLWAQVRETGERRAELTVGTTAAARAVHLDIRGWQGDDDYFDLLPGQERVIALRARSGVGLGGYVMALNARTAAPLKGVS